MQQETTGQAGSTFKLDTFTVCAILGALIVASAVVQAAFELNDGGDYAVWSALEVLARTGAIGVLVLLAALHLGDAPWGASLRRAAPAIGVAVVIASIAIAAKDISDDVGETFWTPLNDFFYYVPITLGAAVFLSAAPRADRVLGNAASWGRVLGAVALVIGLAIAIDDVSNASSDEVWVFLDSFALMGGMALFLLAVSLEPAGSMTQPEGGQLNVAELLNDARLPNWIAIGGVAVIVAGVLLGFNVLSKTDGFWWMLQYWGFYLGLGVMVLIASGGRVAGYGAEHPYLRYALAGGLVAMFIAGVKFAADANSDQVWQFVEEAIAYPGFLALAYVMFEASQRPLRVVR